jgi:uncharacterized protein involved in exopolysaccharide biosynthesis
MMQLRNEPSASSLSEPELNLWDDARAWSRLLTTQWRLMAVVWMVIMAAVVIVVLLWPRTYQSTMKFLVRDARQDLVVNPNDGSVSQFRGGVSEETLNSEIELLRSRHLLARVAAATNLVRGDAGDDSELAIERAVRALNQKLEVHVIRKTNLIQVEYTSREPDQAFAVLKQLAEGYLARHLAVHSSPGAYQFFGSQAVSASSELRFAEDALARLARAENLVAPDEQRTAAMAAASAVEGQLMTVRAQIRETESTLASAVAQTGGLDQRVVTQERTAPYLGAVEHLQTVLTELRNKRTERLTKFNDSDRTIAEVDQQIADTSRDLQEALGSSSKEQSTDLNAHWQSLQSEVITARLRLAGLTAKAQELQTQLTTYRARALEVTEAAPRYDQVRRGVNDARSKYELYVKKQEEARVAEALDTQKISNVVLADPPESSHVPTGPNRRLAVLAGAVAAGLMALGAAVTGDRLRWGAQAADHGGMHGVVVAATPANAAGI